MAHFQSGNFIVPKCFLEQSYTCFGSLNLSRSGKFSGSPQVIQNLLLAVEFLIFFPKMTTKIQFPEANGVKASGKGP